MEGRLPLTTCLNCGAAVHDAFCAHCGQRAVPADPTVSELAGDVFQELSGYDGRIAATFRGLMHPGRLTIDYLAGRRVRYLSPVRVYLTVSVLYFLIAASAPPITTRSGNVTTMPGITISTGRGDAVALTDVDRAELAKSLETAPWLVRQFVTAVQNDPAGLRGRLLTIMPRVFFGMLPVFAGIVSVFYRRRNFPTSLVFAVHLHAFAFLIFSLSEAAKLTRSAAVVATVGGLAALVFTVYALLAFREVFGGRWPVTVVKAAGIGLAYSLAAVPAFLIILIWASLV